LALSSWLSHPFIECVDLSLHPAVNAWNHIRLVSMGYELVYPWPIATDQFNVVVERAAVVLSHAERIFSATVDCSAELLRRVTILQPANNRLFAFSIQLGAWLFHNLLPIGENSSGRAVRLDSAFDFIYWFMVSG